MSSSRRRRRLSPPPQLPDDAIRDILLRTPSDDPRRLVRASLCCKPWRQILSDPIFCRTYRELHRGTQPLLGFIHNKGSAEKPHHCVLVPTTSFRPPGGTHRRNWIVLDSRHGRVLLYSFPPKPDIQFVVWDPITDEQCRLVLPDFTHGSWSATVLCATDGCDHVDCHGGPFLVVFAGLDRHAFASVYSSVSGGWSDTVFVDYPDAAMEQYPGMEFTRFMDSGLGFTLLQGNTVYFPCNMSNRVLEYNIAEERLSVIDTQFHDYYQWHAVLVARGPRRRRACVRRLGGFHPPRACGRGRPAKTALWSGRSAGSSISTCWCPVLAAAARPIGMACRVAYWLDPQTASSSSARMLDHTQLTLLQAESAS
ncbi:uncharacterized protein [Lolium perenne]|uniref:uncharacterized protein n=1 Tax=Lolium perenne TaxID=4522 RepID=UPI0021EA221A|nr:uncharacterized protein LOC127312738 isoform X1 [Lolium perenne]XP_051199244.1 uncharacterized protein LOC127312738 isoform X1 [Lolium perenne]